MAESFHHCNVKASRKQRVCSWCGESINVGEPYHGYQWRDGNDSGTENMHPECYNACKDAFTEDPDLFWSQGDFNRGCCCANGDCKCKIKSDSSQTIAGT